VSLYLSLKWTDWPSFNNFSATGSLLGSAKIKGNPVQAINAAKRRDVL
jgi:long-subunit fatty acid transport protein